MQLAILNDSYYVHKFLTSNASQRSMSITFGENASGLGMQVVWACICKDTNKLTLTTNMTIGLSGSK